MTAAPLAELTIDLGALANNYRLLSARSAPARAGAAVKGNAYGTGMSEAAAALFAAGCRDFFVATLAEGIALRGILSEGMIYVLCGPLEGDGPEYAARRLTPVLNSQPQIELWTRWCSAHGASPAVLHLDTGMSRLGLAPVELESLLSEPARLLRFPITVVMSHLASADEPASPQSHAQLSQFRDALARLVPLLPSRPAVSFANSAGIFLGPDYSFDLTRPGCALYGLAPTAQRPNPMRQVVELKARILQVRHVDAHQTVGYGAAHRATRATRVATLGIGYADGISRHLSHVGVAYVGGVRVPFIGRVSMDLITIDVGGVPERLAAPGAWAEIMGPHHTPDDVAALSGTIGLEVLTSLGDRLPRRYIPAQ
jgi:alanine racemase